MRQGNLSVVLATYNEVEAIGPMVQQLLSQLDQDGGPLLEVIVVDDDSPMAVLGLKPRPSGRLFLILNIQLELLYRGTPC